MEQLSALPTELVVLANPMARAGAWPAEGLPNEREVSLEQGSFAVCLELLVSLPEGGEVLPNIGKELPALSLPAEPILAAADKESSSLATTLAWFTPTSPVPMLAPPVPLPVPPAASAFLLPDVGNPVTTPLGASLEPLPTKSLSMVPQADALAAAAEQGVEPLDVPATAVGETPQGSVERLAVRTDPLVAVAERARAARLEPAQSPAGAVPPTTGVVSAGAEEPRVVAAVRAATDSRGPARVPSERSRWVAGPLAPPSTAPAPISELVPVQRATPALRFTEVLGADRLTVTTVELAPAEPSAAPLAANQTSTSAPSPGTPPLPTPALDLRAPNWQETFAHRVQWLVDQRIGEAHLRLNPPELGALDVKIAFVEDKTFVQLTAAHSAARDELTQSLPRLRELFAASGLELGGASVHGGRGGYPGHDGGAPTRTAGYSIDALSTDPTPQRPERRAAGVIDVFA